MILVFRDVPAQPLSLHLVVSWVKVKILTPAHSERTPPPVHHEGWMISDDEIILCWVSVPWLTTI
jgi:hypothetical protein